MERYVPFEEGEFYHIYNRGVDKRKIFFTKRDYKIFRTLIFGRNSSKRIDLPKLLGDSWRNVDRGNTIVNICAYAQMPNHVHFLLQEKQKGGITTFMRKVMTSFSMYMNRKYDRTGPLMCRPFRAKHIDSDEYFRWLFAYIHLNPLELLDKDWKEKGIQDLHAAGEFLKKYQYSSYPDYFGDERDVSVVLNKDVIPFDVSEFENPVRMLKEYTSNSLGDS